MKTYATTVLIYMEFNEFICILDCHQTFSKYSYNHHSTWLHTSCIFSQCGDVAFLFVFLNHESSNLDLCYFVTIKYHSLCHIHWRNHVVQRVSCTSIPRRDNTWSVTRQAITGMHCHGAIILNQVIHGCLILKWIAETLQHHEVQG